MRKHQQRQILGLLQTLKEAQSVGLYVDCQDGAVGIGEFIESIVGEGSRTVALMEDYCELLYKASIGQAGERQLDKHLLQVENTVKSELRPNRIEIVFLSYKADMSDSIESIYLAAKSDPNCDAFWIPVPYFDRKTDGSFGEMRYEGADRYDGNIICTDWREYDIEVRRPDVIFTFNPYDAGNYVTSVHPDYYCERLRNLTDLLVYVPYFVLAGDAPEHFCTVAGCVYAHKVIVQAKKIRDTYIRVFKKAYGNGYGRAEDKFAALGSPKFDRILSSRRECHELPQNWSDLIGDRKAVLFNTSISAMLEKDEQYLIKLRYVLETFRSRDDIVLWWRPHPLVEATYSSMRPQLFEDYKQIVADYKRKNFGIYDDTTNLHRALAWTDACYGDGGSIVSMCQIKGKPVMRSRVDITHNEAEFLPVCIYVHDDWIWVIARRINALFKMSKTTWSPEYIGSFPDETECVPERTLPLYLRPAIKDGLIYFPPLLAKEISAYSVKDSVFEKIKFNDVGRDFCEAIAYGNYVYFIPRRYPGILRLDTETRETACFSDWVEPLRKLIDEPDTAYTFFAATTGSTVLLAPLRTNVVIEFDMETHLSSIHEVGKTGHQYSGICCDGENCWLSPHNNTPVVKWNRKTGETKEFSEFICNDKDTRFSFLPPVLCGGYVWLLPIDAEHVYKIDMKTDEFCIAEEFEADFRLEDGRSSLNYRFAQVFGSSVYAFNEQSKMLIEYNCETKQLREEKVKYPPESSAQIKRLSAGSLRAGANADSPEDYCYYESDQIDLSDFLNYLTLYGDTDEASEINRIQAERARAKNENADGTAGKAIYDYIIRISIC